MPGIVEKSEQTSSSGWRYDRCKSLIAKKTKPKTHQADLMAASERQNKAQYLVVVVGETKEGART